jgi:zinc transport system substrate-binding protein
LVEELAGSLVTEDCVLPVGEDSVTWMPSPEKIANIQGADLIIGNGAGFEAWVKTVSLPTSKLILSATGLDLIRGESSTHSHGKGGDHSHGEIDPHTWASVALYKKQASAVSAALNKVLPEDRVLLSKNLKILHGNLDSLDLAYKEVFAPLSDLKMAANHPSYSYLARDYALQIQAFDFAPELAVDVLELESFNHWVEGIDSPILLWESQPSQVAKDSFPKNVRHIYIDPLEQPNGDYDYISQAKANIKRFQSIPIPLNIGE